MITFRIPYIKTAQIIKIKRRTRKELTTREKYAMQQNAIKEEKLKAQKKEIWVKMVNQVKRQVKMKGYFNKQNGSYDKTFNINGVPFFCTFISMLLCILYISEWCAMIFA